MRGRALRLPQALPGKGHSPLDAHLKLPTIDSTLEEMEEIHLPPFREAIAAGVECLMTYTRQSTQLGSQRGARHVSRRLVHDWLRS